jgi:hypothetical protein
MEDHQSNTNGTCKACGCSEAQAGEKAHSIGFWEEFRAGRYTCCQIALWADEQELSWRTAAEEEAVKEATRPAGSVKLDDSLVPVLVKRRHAKPEPRNAQDWWRS